MTRISRRAVMRSIAGGIAGGVLGWNARSVAGTPAPDGTRKEGELDDPKIPAALAGGHTLAPLPFAPGRLKGLSEKLIQSHYEKNYGGAVRNLNRVEQELSRIGPDTPPFVVAALRDRELTFRNSKTLHEAYFGNLGGSGRRAGAVESAIAQAYGSSARWEEHFRATAAGLGGGSGWVVLALELDTGALRSVALANHAQALATAVPLLVLDLYEHSYQMDFGADVATYVERFFANVQWEEVGRRFEIARRAAEVLRADRS